MSMELIALDRQIIELGNALATWQDAYNTLKDQFDEQRRQLDEVRTEHAAEMAGRMFLANALRNELPDSPVFLPSGMFALWSIMDDARHSYRRTGNISMATVTAKQPSLPESEVAQLRARIDELEQFIADLGGERDGLGRDLVKTTAYYTALKEHLQAVDPENPLLNDFTKMNLVERAWQEWERTSSWTAVKEFGASFVSLADARLARGGLLKLTPDEGTVRSTSSEDGHSGAAQVPSVHDNSVEPANTAEGQASEQLRMASQLKASQGQQAQALRQLVGATAYYTALGTHLNALMPSHPVLTEQAWEQLQELAWREWCQNQDMERVQAVGASFLPTDMDGQD